MLRFKVPYTVSGMDEWLDRWMDDREGGKNKDKIIGVLK